MSMSIIPYLITDTDEWNSTKIELYDALDDLNLGGSKDIPFVIRGLLTHATHSLDIGGPAYRPLNFPVLRAWTEENTDPPQREKWLTVLDHLEKNPDLYLYISW